MISTEAQTVTNMSTPSTRASTVREHPVPAYFLLAFLISWGGIAGLVLPGGLPKTSGELDALYLPVFLVMLCGPSIAGLAMTLLLDGRSGLGALFRSFTRWRVGFGYYLFALVAPAIALIVLGAFSAFSPVFTPTVLGATGGMALLATSLVIGFAAGFLEELGWTGFAARRLLLTRSVVMTAVLIGVPHGLWHLLVGYFWGDGASFGLLFIPYFVSAWIMTLTALRMLIVWLYQRTQSGLVAALTHAGYTASLVALWPVGTAPAETMIWTGVFAATLLAAATALTRSFPNRLVPA